MLFLKSIFRFSVAIISLCQCHSLSFLDLNEKNAPPPIKRVAIIGAGIGGLSLAHVLGNSEECAAGFLDKLEKNPGAWNSKSSSIAGIDVEVFESRSVLDFKAGSGIQLSGGMAVLKKMNPAVQKAIAQAALPLKTIRSKTKPWIQRNDGDECKLFEFDIESAIRNQGDDVQSKLIINNEVMCYAIMRGALQEILLDQLPKDVRSNIKLGKRLCSIKGVKGEGIFCEFNDGTSEGPFDLVVGCDGVNSAVKEFVNTGKDYPYKKLGQKKEAAIYSGIRIQYTIQDGKEENDGQSIQSSEFTQCFGDGVYALSAQYGNGEGKPPSYGAALCFQDDDFIGPFRKKDRSIRETASENADWIPDPKDLSEIQNDDMNLIKASGLPGSTVTPIIENSDKVFELGVYYHNPISLNGWSREVKNSGGRFCVLGGDAAHTMPPFLGQGANQAIQDAFCLGTKIFEYNESLLKSSEVTEENAPSLKRVLKEYENIRWGPTASITFKSIILGYVETGSGLISKVRDTVFFVLGNLGIAQKVFLSAAKPKVEN